ncbi:MAG: HDOD domain-containing protein [Oscillospiraceae bacterium]
MNSKYIVRQPIKDAESKIVGYEILYYGENQAFSGETPASSNDFAAADTIYNFLTQNTDKVLRGSRSFMTFTTTLLLKKTPRLFDKSELVIQIDDSVIIHPLAMHLVQQYSREGYQIAVNEFQFAPRYLALLDSIDYIKLNFENANEITLHNIVEIAHSMKKKCIAVGIDAESTYQRAIAMKVDAMEGSYVAEKLAVKAHTSGYLQSNFFGLMVAVTKDEPDVDEIERIISRDAALTYGLLKMANSIYFALRHRATTIQQAIMTLGLGQLKQWIYLLSASNAENQMDPASEEFLKLSFMRGNFCRDLMDYATDMPISKAEAYLMGMFSTLNYLIDAPLEEILSSIPVADEVRNALLRHTGRCGLLYDLALSYERADWPSISELAGQLEIPSNLLAGIYFNCVENVNTTWDQLTNSGQDDEDDLLR